MIVDESSVINEVVLVGIQYFVDEVLEGSYWIVKWVVDGQIIEFYGIIGIVVGCIKLLFVMLENDF